MVRSRRGSEARPCFRDLSGAHVSVSSRYRLIDRSDAEVRAWIPRLPADLVGDPDFGGILVPVGPLGQAQALSHTTAALCRRLTEGLLPFGEIASFLDVVSLARLVLDGALAIQGGTGACSGPSAYSVLFDSTPTYPDAGSRVWSMSRRALVLATELAGEPPEARSRWLYRYGWAPCSQDRTRRLGDDLRRSLGGAYHSAKGRNWSWRGEAGGWSIWTRPGRPTTTGSPARHKIYLSPRPEHTTSAVRAILEDEDLPALAFKIPARAELLLRPDRIVLYFDDDSALRDALGILQVRLTGMEAQGVPFTCSGPDPASGLLSWGVDPRPSGGSLGVPDESWRLFLTRVLGTTLALAESTHDALPAPVWMVALERLALEGIDATTFAPSAGFEPQEIR